MRGTQDVADCPVDGCEAKIDIWMYAQDGDEYTCACGARSRLSWALSLADGRYPTLSEAPPEPAPKAKRRKP